MAYDARHYASPHFSWREFACHNWQRTAYPADWRESRGLLLAAELEQIRARLSEWQGTDTPLYLNSVYRTPDWNTEVGGKTHSQHLEGRAADICCPHGCTFAQLRAAVLEVARRPESKIRYVCVYPHQGFVHIDIRSRATLLVEEDTV
jgi:uncharacterized protein YcbK (DUF882 family)